MILTTPRREPLDQQRSTWLTASQARELDAYLARTGERTGPMIRRVVLVELERARVSSRG